MHIIYFHQHFASQKGTAGIRSYQMARKSVNNGHKATMICGSYQGGDTGLSGVYTRSKLTGLVDSIDVIEFDLGYSNTTWLARVIEGVKT